MKPPPPPGNKMVNLPTDLPFKTLILLFRFLRPARFARIVTVVVKLEHLTDLTVFDHRNTLRMTKYVMKLSKLLNPPEVKSGKF